MRLMILALVLLMAGCERADNGGASYGEWKSLGYAGDSNSGTTVFRRTDPDTGDMVYVTSKGGVYIVKATK